MLDIGDEQILGIRDDYGGLNLPMDLNGPQFRLGIRFDGEMVPEVEVAQLNALVNGDRPTGVQGRGRRRCTGRHRGRQ